MSKIVPEYFKVRELVHPDIYTRYGEGALYLLDEGMLAVIDHLRFIFGKCKINGSGFIDSGLRTTYGSAGSAHRFGCAFDLKFEKARPAEVHEYIHANQKELYALGLRRVEALADTPTWTHVDGKPAPIDVLPGNIHFFKP